MTLGRRIIATLLLVLACMVATSTVTYLYLDQHRPTDAIEVKSLLGSAELKSTFRVEDAQKAGYSEIEIASLLAEHNSELNKNTMHRLLLIESALFLICILVSAAIYLCTPKAKLRDVQSCGSECSK